MQNIIDLIAEKIMQDFSGMILAWSGAILDIPSGWVICDGTNSTPDLTDKFLYGAGGTKAVDATGGATTHAHSFVTDGHHHGFEEGDEFSGGEMDQVSDVTATDSGTTNLGSSMPPWYVLAYIMKT